MSLSVSVTGPPPLSPRQQCPETLPHAPWAPSGADVQAVLACGAFPDPEGAGAKVPVICRAVLWSPGTPGLSWHLRRSGDGTSRAGDAPCVSGPAPPRAAAFPLALGLPLPGAAQVVQESGCAAGEVLWSRVRLTSDLGDAGSLRSSGCLTRPVPTEVLLGSG